jgi:uncharacterized protein (TIGR02246 family)
MKMQICFPVLFLFFAFSNLLAQDSQQEALIKKKTDAYVEAYNKHDPDAVAAFWAENGEYINPESGKTIVGKAAIKAAFKSHFQAHGDTQLDVKINSITFPSKDEALEIGLFHVRRPGKKPKESAFKAFFENKNGEWLISEIRDVDIAAVPDQYQHLKELEWLIGEWVDKDEDVEIKTSYKWDSSKNFIFGNFSVTTEGKLELKGTHIIGWDPIKKKIRSWVFDTDGTFGESTWTKKGNVWVVENAQTLANGSRASAINIYTPIDQNSYSWEATGREVGGKILPDINPIIIKRKKG